MRRDEALAEEVRKLLAEPVSGQSEAASIAGLLSLFSAYLGLAEAALTVGLDTDSTTLRVMSAAMAQSFGTMAATLKSQAADIRCLRPPGMSSKLDD